MSHYNIIRTKNPQIQWHHQIKKTTPGLCRYCQVPKQLNCQERSFGAYYHGQSQLSLFECAGFLMASDKQRYALWMMWRGKSQTKGGKIEIFICIILTFNKKISFQSEGCDIQQDKASKWGPRRIHLNDFNALNGKSIPAHYKGCLN